MFTSCEVEEGTASVHGGDNADSWDPGYGVLIIHVYITTFVFIVHIAYISNTFIILLKKS